MEDWISGDLNPEAEVQRKNSEMNWFNGCMEAIIPEVVSVGHKKG